MPHLDDFVSAPVSKRFWASREITLMNKKVWDRCGNCYGTGKVRSMLRLKRSCQVCGGTGYFNRSIWVADLPEKKSVRLKAVVQRGRNTQKKKKIDTMKPSEPAPSDSAVKTYTFAGKLTRKQ
jgi:DnaJ-class molecular chaperone